MITKWIAQALINGQDHLTLTLAQLAQWHRNGCTVDLGAPFRSLGGYAQAHIGRCGLQLEERLIATPPSEWPVGPDYAGKKGNGRHVVMPSLEFTQIGNDAWRVPLIPSDLNHCVDSWAFDLQLSSEELEALKPVALQIVNRTLLRCEIKNAENLSKSSIHWNPGRIALAEIAGVDRQRIASWFGLAPSSLKQVHEVNTLDSVERSRSQAVDRAKEILRREILDSRRPITQDKKFIYEMQVRGNSIHCNHYTIDFFSRLISAGPTAYGVNNLTLKLTRAELIRLREMIDESLGMKQVTIV